MRFSRFIAVTGAAAFALWCLPVPAAGPMFKCQGPGGQLTFSDRPCADEQHQEIGKAAPPPGQVDVAAMCGPAAPAAAGVSRKGAVCQQMRACAAKKGHADCRVYCTAFDGAESMLPGVQFGPTSPSCLRYNDLVGGKNWVQTSARVSGAGYEMLPATCVDAAGRATRPVFLACEPGTTNCAIEAPQSGRRPRPAPIDELMAQACGT